MEFLTNVAESFWDILYDSAFFILIGVVLAGLIHLFLNEKSLKRWLKGDKKSTVFKSALFGIPLPLCSCSVLPVASQLKRNGLSNGGTASFLISTPETGVDSILLTYSLTDPILTVARPVTAFVTAVTAGLIINQTEIDDRGEIEEENCGCSDGCSSGTEDSKQEMSLFGKIKYAVHYALFDLLADLAPYLLFGFVLAAIVGALFSFDMNSGHLWFQSQVGGYITALVIGLPLYICATSSTPLAAVMLAGGFSPGAVLIFLLVGPATNMATLTVVKKILNLKALVIYLLVIALVSLLSGLLLDYIYNIINYSADYQNIGTEHQFGLVKQISAVLLLLFILYISFKKLLKKFR